MALIAPSCSPGAPYLAKYPAIENGGRTFVVDFDTTPRLAHPTSAAAASVSAAIDRIGAGGGVDHGDVIPSVSSPSAGVGRRN